MKNCPKERQVAAEQRGQRVCISVILLFCHNADILCMLQASRGIQQGMLSSLIAQQETQISSLKNDLATKHDKHETLLPTSAWQKQEEEEVEEYEDDFDDA